ncbi:hypothetical protein C8Q75DRAFT_97579 [Abortiporus biennis]|nr:hypothetical protein C8Q75DRAFT_97579 [Abortiporus biennis]
MASQFLNYTRMFNDAARLFHKFKSKFRRKPPVQFSSLPVEIMMLIFENLDHTTLVQSSLVCWHWRSIIRPIMFREICIHIAWKTVLPICDFLDSTPDVCQFVKSLHVTGPEDLVTSNFHNKATPSISSYKLLCLLSRLPSLQRLTMSFIKFTISSPSYFERRKSTYTTFPNVEYLDLSAHFKFSDEDESILSILSFFPYLQTLDFGPLLDRTPLDTETISAIVRNTGLHGLKFSSLSSGVIDLIDALSQRQQIRSVDFASIMAPDHFAEFLGEFGNQLQHLGFGLDENFLDEWDEDSVIIPSWHDIGLSQCTSLKSIKVVIALSLAKHRFKYHWINLLAILDQLPPTIQSFTLKIELHCERIAWDFTHEIMQLGWKDFREKLKEGLPNLDILIIEIVDDNEKAVLKFLRDRRKLLLEEWFSKSFRSYPRNGVILDLEHPFGSSAFVRHWS